MTNECRGWARAVIDTWKVRLLNPLHRGSRARQAMARAIWQLQDCIHTTHSPIFGDRRLFNQQFGCSHSLLSNANLAVGSAIALGLFGSLWLQDTRKMVCNPVRNDRQVEAADGMICTLSVLSRFDTRTLAKGFLIPGSNSRLIRVVAQESCMRSVQFAMTPEPSREGF